VTGVFAVPEEFSVPVGGAVISGEQRGAIPRLVFVHGMAGERHDWDRLLAWLPSDLTYLRYDLRGFGRSTAQEGVAFSHSDDLLAVLDARGVLAAGIVGLSMGGGIALNFALNHPRRVSRLILISPWMIGWEASHEWKTLWRAVAAAAQAGEMALARERWLRHPMFALVREDEELAAELCRSIEGYHGRQWIADDQRAEFPDIERLHTLAMPTLVLTGEHDLPDVRLIAQTIVAAAPDASRVDYAGAGHMVHLERASQAAATIGRFIA
jgi:pimeloyl-ACP methyl ester carboxylesterase